MGVNLLSLGARAMSANQAALATIGHNISNANTEGYSRQQVELATSGGMYTGVGYFGRGVDVATVSRASDGFLTRQAVATRSVAAGDEAREAQLAMLEQILPTGEDGLGYATGQMLNAFVDVANNPGDLSARQVVLSRAEDLAARFNSANAALDDLQSGVVTDLRTNVGVVNDLAKQIASINMKIASMQGTGNAPNDLLDQRDQLVAQLADKVSVTTIAADDGSLNVFVANGQNLVLGGHAQQLAVVDDEYDPSQAHVAVVDGPNLRLMPDNSFGGGQIDGLLRFQSSDLAAARNQLAQLATAVVSRVNEQQSYGLDLQGQSGTAVFSYDAAQAVPSSYNAKDAAGNFIAPAPTLTIVDASQLQASDYRLQPDPSAAGSYQLTRLSDGLVRTIASGDVVDGMQIDIGTPAPGASDRFLLQPVSRTIGTLDVVLEDPRGLAAASPVTASLGTSNTGTASVAALAVTSASYDPALSANIAFTSGTGAYTWELRDASNAVVSTGTGTWTAGTPIQVNGFSLDLAGVPANGDTIAVGPTTYPAANNGNARAMMALSDEPLVGRRLNSSGALIGGETATNAYASAIAEIGTRVQSSRTSAAVSRQVADATETMRANEVGVNLDEEAAKLMQYQQAYSAAARILQVAQSVFDTLLQTTA